MYDFLVEPVVRAALLEDIGHGADITTQAIAEPLHAARANIAARKAGTIYGHVAAKLAFTLLESGARYEVVVPDGESVAAGGVIATVAAGAATILTGERTALNFLCHLSGVATATRALVDLINAYPARVVCTRKTTPGLRMLEKAAVVAGGGSNHRYGLDDAVLIKDNHIALAGGIGNAVRAVRERVGHMVKVEVEVDTLDQLREALELPIDAVLLDNMETLQLSEAVKIVGGRIITEASGSINAQRIVAIAQTGVDLISSGAITHSAPALDLGLDIAL
ncbi:MAG: carboxylating nicotinate-nucleotide diphosphorylase [Candidatus Eremiobacteraeota bacterium]|nr:carboxylating nicotinate-nucleotide diphosphorylase [Candidatus Eremiobacteraeota bacterium]